MTRSFVELPEFSNSWENLGLSESNLNEFKLYLTENPGAGGVRKIRWAVKGKGKRGGARVCYIDFVVIETMKYNINPNKRKI